MSISAVSRRARPANRIKPSTDAYTARMLASVNQYLNWLTTNNLKGYIGEFGWRTDFDDYVAWQRFAEALYTALVGGPDVWITAWIGSENYPEHRLAIYRGSNTAVIGSATTPLSSPTYGAKVVEQHRGFGRGINIGNSGEDSMYDNSSSTAAFSNTRELAGVTFGSLHNLTAAPVPDNYSGGPLAVGWNYGTQATWDYLGSRGVQLVRLPFRWERMQRTLSGALDTTEVARVTTALGYAAANNISVILDCHNFGAYRLDNGTTGVLQALGSAGLTAANFTDLWTRMATQFDSNSAVLGYDIMNEPFNVTTAAWTTGGLAQAGLNGVRAAGSTKCVLVALPQYSEPTRVSGLAPYITDSANNFRYEMHYYGDYNTNTTSQYGTSYATELSLAKTAGFSGTDNYPTVANGPTCYDSFGNRPDTGSNTAGGLGNTEDPSHAYWQSRYSGAFGYSGGRAIVYNNPGPEVSTFVQAWSADLTLDVDMVAIGSNGGVLLRGDGLVTSAGTYLTIQLGVGSTATLYARTSAGGYTNLGAYTNTWADGDHLRAVCSGSNITLYQVRGGVTVNCGTIVTTTYQTGTCFGLRMYNSTTPRWANFSLA